jgi:hypothetical protein
MYRESGGKYDDKSIEQLDCFMCERRASGLFIAAALAGGKTAPSSMRHDDRYEEHVMAQQGAREEKSCGSI